ncbi:MAG: GH85 family endohexosaminidase C-terminal domain-containing protein [Bifidobacterium breve]
MYAGARISWKTDGKAPAYEIYQINEDKSRSFLGVSNVENFYANALTRVGETNNTTFEIVPVDRYGTQGERQADMDWPDNSKPKAGATASHTAECGRRSDVHLRKLEEHCRGRLVSARIAEHTLASPSPSPTTRRACMTLRSPRRTRAARPLRR